jgi:intein/homing endonuclease
MIKEEFKALALKHKGQFCYSWTGDSYGDIEVQLNYIDKNVDINGCVGRMYTKADTEYKKELERVKKQRADTVKDILVTLELGGTKAELEEMLAKVGA